MILCMAWAAPLLVAAPLLTSEEAVRLAVEKNFSLSLARDETAMASLNRKTGIGPFLPSLSASGNHGGSLLDSTSPQTSVGASLNLILFDGFQNYHAYQGLKSREKSAGLQEQLALENLLELVLAGYFEIVRQERRLDALRDLLAVSEERAKLAQAKMELGAGSKLEQLQSLADLNADSSAYLSQEAALHEARINLNLMLARDPAVEFEVVDSIPLESMLPLEKWRSALPEINTALLQAEVDRQIRQTGLQEARGGRWPEVNAGLNYSARPDALNSGLGAGDDDLRYNVTLTVPLFDRLQSRRRVGTARLEVRESETRFQKQKEEIAAAFEQAAQRHALGMRQVNLEERNLEVARLQAEAARERYRIGSSTPLEFRDAQRKLLDARSRLASARKDAKSAELTLKRLSGNLVSLTPQPPLPR